MCGRVDAATFRVWWDELTRYRRNQDTSLSNPGKAIVALVEGVFARPATARKLISAHAEEEKVRVRPYRFGWMFASDRKRPSAHRHFHVVMVPVVDQRH